MFASTADGGRAARERALQGLDLVRRLVVLGRALGTDIGELVACDVRVTQHPRNM